MHIGCVLWYFGSHYAVSCSFRSNLPLSTDNRKDSTMTPQETTRNHGKTQPCAVLVEVADVAEVAEVSAHYAVSLLFFLWLSAESGGLLQKLRKLPEFQTSKLQNLGRIYAVSVVGFTEFLQFFGANYAVFPQPQGHHKCP